MNDPRVLGAKQMVIAEAKRWQQYEKLSTLTEEDKSAADRPAWAAWMAKYIEFMHAAAVHTNIGSDGPDWAKLEAARQEEMSGANPRYILRNYIAQAAVHRAEQGDYEEARRVLARVRDPFGRTDGVAGGAPVEFSRAAIAEQRDG